MADDVKKKWLRPCGSPRRRERLAWQPIRPPQERALLG